MSMASWSRMRLVACGLELPGKFVGHPDDIVLSAIFDQRAKQTAALLAAHRRELPDDGGELARIGVIVGCGAKLAVAAQHDQLLETRLVPVGMRACRIGAFTAEED